MLLLNNIGRGERSFFFRFSLRVILESGLSGNVDLNSRPTSVCGTQEKIWLLVLLFLFALITGKRLPASVRPSCSATCNGFVEAGLVPHNGIFPCASGKMSVVLSSKFRITTSNSVLSICSRVSRNYPILFIVKLSLYKISFLSLSCRDFFFLLLISAGTSSCMILSFTSPDVGFSIGGITRHNDPGFMIPGKAIFKLKLITYSL